MPAKVICAVHGRLGPDVPAIPALRAYAVHVPARDHPAEHPADVGGVAMAWLEDDAPLEPSIWFAPMPVTAYLVEEHVRIDYRRDWPIGTPSPGVRRISFVRRAPEVTRAEMASHWGLVHFPLARVHHPAIWHYVQNVVVRALTPTAPEVDGIAELHFRTAEDLRDRFYDSEEGRRAIAADVRRFLDPSLGWRLVGEETWLLG